MIRVMLRQHVGFVLGTMAATAVGLAALVALSFPVFVQLQNRALDDCTVRFGEQGTVSVEWKLWPPGHACLVEGREARHSPPVR